MNNDIATAVTVVLVGLATAVTAGLVYMAPGHKVSTGFFGDVCIRDGRGRYVSQNQAAANGLVSVISSAWNHFTS